MRVIKIIKKIVYRENQQNAQIMRRMSWGVECVQIKKRGKMIKTCNLFKFQKLKIQKIIEWRVPTESIPE